MAHELDNSTGIYSFAAVGGAASAWHGLGQSIERGDSIDTITQKAGLNWNANRAPVIYNTADGRAMSFDNQSVLYRSDTGAALGVVSENRYNVHQPREIMEFFADFLNDNGLSIETAGAVRGGRIVWCMAKLGPDYGFLMPGNDKVDSYIRLQTSFDGSRATDLVATTVRQVCANTMRMVDRDALERGYKNKHSTQFDSAGLARAFGLLGEQHRITGEQWNALARVKVDNKTALDFLAGLLDINPHAQAETAELRVSHDFWKQTPELQREVLTHEMLHIVTARLDQTVEAMEEAFGKIAWAIYDPLYEDATERVVDHLAKVIAPGLPLPEFPKA